MDLNKANFTESAEQGYEFNLIYPTGEASDAYIKVRGDMSKTVKDYVRRKFNEMEMKRAAARRRGKEPDDMTLEEAEELAVESASVRVIDWRGISEGGVELACTPENTKRILKDHPWIREQVTKEASLLINFRPEGI